MNRYPQRLPNASTVSAGRSFIGSPQRNAGKIETRLTLITARSVSLSLPITFAGRISRLCRVTQNVGRAVHNVVVGNDVTIRRNNHAASRPCSYCGCCGCIWKNFLLNPNGPKNSLQAHLSRRCPLPLLSCADASPLSADVFEDHGHINNGGVPRRRHRFHGMNNKGAEREQSTDAAVVKWRRRKGGYQNW